MPTLQVLVDDNGDVLGTAQLDASSAGPDAPQTSSMVAREGQRVVEVTVGDDVATLEAGALHAAIKSDHL
jgi:hypothetical protein